MKNPTALHIAIDRGARAVLHEAHTGLPGRLEAYDAQTGRAKVKPLVQAQDRDGNLIPLPVIASVPVFMPGGAAAAIYLPPKVGDTGWIAFAERSMERWLAQGDDAPPGDPRVMDLTDAVFFPGLRSFSDGSGAEEADAAFIRCGDSKLKLRAGKVALGNKASPVLPAGAPISGLSQTFQGPVEVMAMIGRLLDCLADVTLVTGGASINPAFTTAMLQLRANWGQIMGDL